MIILIAYILVNCHPNRFEVESATVRDDYGENKTYKELEKKIKKIENQFKTKIE